MMEYFHMKDSGVTYFQEADERCEKCSEEKKAKECTICTFDSRPMLSQRATFNRYSSIPGLWPVLDLLKPPPEVEI